MAPDTVLGRYRGFSCEQDRLVGGGGESLPPGACTLVKGSTLQKKKKSHKSINTVSTDCAKYSVRSTQDDVIDSLCKEWLPSGRRKGPL